MCSTIMSRFSDGPRSGAGLGRDTLAPRAVRLSSRSTRPVGDCSLAVSDAFASTVAGMWLSTLLFFGGGVIRFVCMAEPGKRTMCLAGESA